MVLPSATLPRLPPPPRRSGELRFQERVAQLEEKYRQLWWQISREAPLLGGSFDDGRQRGNLRRSEVLIDRVAQDLEAYPDSRDRQGVEGSIKDAFREFAISCLDWPQDEARLLLSEETFRISRQFLRQARRFDPEIQAEDLFQALRNVWIMNGIQILLGRRRELTAATFAYSLLYPYTDNPLDSPDVDATVKHAAGERLTLRLQGLPMEPENAREDSVFRLVEMIEGQFDRSEFPDVYQSLLAIHRAQSRSLLQHGGPSPYEIDVLGISFAKGGSSVLADGYLVAGTLSEAEADVLFGYGCVLQLLDDLQDLGCDRQAGHTTIFTQTARSWPLDRVTHRLADFMDHVLSSGEDLLGGPQRRVHWRAIRRNCTYLLLQAVGNHRKLFTRREWRRLERHSPLAFSSFKRLRRRVEKRRKRLQRAWQGKEVDLAACE